MSWHVIISNCVNGQFHFKSFAVNLTCSFTQERSIIGRTCYDITLKSSLPFDINGSYTFVKVGVIINKWYLPLEIEKQFSVLDGCVDNMQEWSISASKSCGGLWRLPLWWCFILVHSENTLHTKYVYKSDDGILYIIRTINHYALIVLL